MCKINKFLQLHLGNNFIRPRNLQKFISNRYSAVWHHPHLAAAAFAAISRRSSLVNFSARAFALAYPERTRPDFSASVSSISPVAILATVTAQPTTSAGRFCLIGPVGMY